MVAGRRGSVWEYEMWAALCPDGPSERDDFRGAVGRRDLNIPPSSMHAPGNESITRVFAGSD